MGGVAQYLCRSPLEVSPAPQRFLPWSFCPAFCLACFISLPPCSRTSARQLPSRWMQVSHKQVIHSSSPKACKQPCHLQANKVVVGPVTCNLKATSPQWMMRQATTFHCQLSPANAIIPRRKTRWTKSRITICEGCVCVCVCVWPSSFSQLR